VAPKKKKLKKNPQYIYIRTVRPWLLIKGGLRSEDTGNFLRLQHKYSKALSWAENLNKFTVLGGKFKFSAKDSGLEYLCW